VAVNFGTFVAGISIAPPVRGLRPFLAFLLKTEKIPNPTSVTFWPFFNDPLMALIITSSACVASD